MRRADSVRAPLEGLERGVHQLVGRALPHEPIVIAKELDDFGLAQQRVAHEPARSEHSTHPLRRARRLAEGRGERLRPGGSFSELAQLEQAEIRVGCIRQPVEDDGQQLLHEA